MNHDEKDDRSMIVVLKALYNHGFGPRLDLNFVNSRWHISAFLGGFAQKLLLLLCLVHFEYLRIEMRRGEAENVIIAGRDEPTPSGPENKATSKQDEDNSSLSLRYSDFKYAIIALLLGRLLADIQILTLLDETCKNTVNKAFKFLLRYKKLSSAFGAVIIGVVGLAFAFDPATVIKESFGESRWLKGLEEEYFDFSTVEDINDMERNLDSGKMKGENENGVDESSEVDFYDLDSEIDFAGGLGDDDPSIGIDIDRSEDDDPLKIMGQSESSLLMENEKTGEQCIAHKKKSCLPQHQKCTEEPVECPCKDPKVAGNLAGEDPKTKTDKKSKEKSTDKSKFRDKSATKKPVLQKLPANLALALLFLSGYLVTSITKTIGGESNVSEGMRNVMIEDGFSRTDGETETTDGKDNTKTDDSKAAGDETYDSRLTFPNPTISRLYKLDYISLCSLRLTSFLHELGGWIAMGVVGRLYNSFPKFYLDLYNFFQRDFVPLLMELPFMAEHILPILQNSVMPWLAEQISWLMAHILIPIVKTVIQFTDHHFRGRYATGASALEENLQQTEIIARGLFVVLGLVSLLSSMKMTIWLVKSTVAGSGEKGRSSGSTSKAGGGVEKSPAVLLPLLYLFLSDACLYPFLNMKMVLIGMCITVFLHFFLLFTSLATKLENESEYTEQYVEFLMEEGEKIQLEEIDSFDTRDKYLTVPYLLDSNQRGKNGRGLLDSNQASRETASQKQDDDREIRKIDQTLDKLQNLQDQKKKSTKVRDYDIERFERLKTMQGVDTVDQEGMDRDDDLIQELLVRELPIEEMSEELGRELDPHERDPVLKNFLKKERDFALQKRWNSAFKGMESTVAASVALETKNLLKKSGFDEELSADSENVAKATEVDGDVVDSNKKQLSQEHDYKLKYEKVDTALFNDFRSYYLKMLAGIGGFELLLWSRVLYGHLDSSFSSPFGDCDLFQNASENIKMITNSELVSTSSSSPHLLTSIYVMKTLTINIVKQCYVFST